MTCYCKSFTLPLTGSHPHFRYGRQWALLRSFPRLHIGASDSSASLQRREDQKHACAQPWRWETQCIMIARCLLRNVCSRHIIVSRLVQILTSSSLSVGWWSAPLSWSLRCRRRSSAVRCVRLTRVWRWTAAASLNLLCAVTATPPTAWHWCITAPPSLTNKWWVLDLVIFIIIIYLFFYVFNSFLLLFFCKDNNFCIYLIVLLRLFTSAFYLTKSVILFLLHVFGPAR